MSFSDKKIIKDLIEGELQWPTLKSMMSSHKDDDRFDTYIAVLQDRVAWDDPILLPIGEHLYIVAGVDGRIVKCDCGQEFGDYRTNWKLSANVRVRADKQSVEEIYPGRQAPDPDWMEIREFICPGCTTLLEVEAAPPGFPIVFDFLPDLETFYNEWLGRPIPERA